MSFFCIDLFMTKVEYYTCMFGTTWLKVGTAFYAKLLKVAFTFEAHVNVKSPCFQTHTILRHGWEIGGSALGYILMPEWNIF